MTSFHILDPRFTVQKMDLLDAVNLLTSDSSPAVSSQFPGGGEQSAQPSSPDDDCRVSLLL